MPFNYRSTNTIGYTHFSGALVVGTELGSGIELNPSSTSAAANIMPAGDETDKTIQIQGKGAGGVLLGATSTSACKGMQQYLIQWTPAALAASAASQSTITVTGLATNSALFFTCMTPGASAVYAYRVQCSTANELRFTQQNIGASTIGTGESTARGLLLEVKF